MVLEAKDVREVALAAYNLSVREGRDGHFQVLLLAAAFATQCQQMGISKDRALEWVEEIMEKKRKFALIETESTPQ